MLISALHRRPDCDHLAQSEWSFTFGTLPGCSPTDRQGCVCSNSVDLHIMCEIAGVPHGTTFFVSVGDGKPRPDVWPGRVPIVTKARWVGGPGVILPMDAVRYWEGAVWNLPHRVPWEQKMEAIVWRGDVTGMDRGSSMQRGRFVHALREAGHDVGFFLPEEISKGIFDGLRRNHGRPSKWSDDLNRTVLSIEDVKPYLSMQAMAGYKYLLCLEGNDAATSTRWMLASDSVVVMPPPTTEDWALEGKLQPYVHYVPLRSPSHINETLKWLLEHDAEAKSIVANANAFVRSRLWRHPCPRASLDDGQPRRQQLTLAISADTEAERRAILECLLEPSRARALIMHAASAWADVNRTLA